MRPNDRDPGAGSSRLRRFSRPRYLDRRATLIETSLVTIDVHGSLDRAKDVSSSVRALFRRHHEECVRLAHADDVPLLILPEDTCCRRCDRLHGNEPRTGEPDRPRPALFRQPAKAIGIPRIRVPSTVANRGDGRGSLLFVSRVGLPLTPPTRCPHGWGQCAGEGMARASVGTGPALTSREQVAFSTRWKCRAWA
jgi:hypothetical protein